MIADERTQRNIESCIKQVLEANGGWVYMARAKHSKNVRDYIVDTAVATMGLMGLNIEVDGYHKCRLRIKP